MTDFALISTADPNRVGYRRITYGAGGLTIIINTDVAGALTWVTSLNYILRSDTVRAAIEAMPNREIQLRTARGAGDRGNYRALNYDSQGRTIQGVGVDGILTLFTDVLSSQSRLIGNSLALEQRVTLAHELLHAALGAHAWGSGVPQTQMQVYNDPVYNRQWEFAAEWRYAYRADLPPPPAYAGRATYYVSDHGLNPNTTLSTHNGRQYYITPTGAVAYVLPHATWAYHLAESKYYSIVYPDRPGAVSHDAAFIFGGSDADVVGMGFDPAEFRRAIELRDAASESSLDDIGAIIGSSLGNVLGGGRVAGILYSSLLGEIGERIGLGLALGGSADDLVDAATQGGLESFGHDVAVRAGQAVIGTVSSWLTMELGEALGLEGFGAELFNTVGTAVTTHIIGNLINAGPNFVFAGLNTHELAEGLGGAGANLASALTSAVGSFLGAKLGAMVVNPQTQAAVTLSSIGTAVGSFLAIKSIGIVGSIAQAAGGLFSGKLAFLGNAIVPGVGAFIGFVVGALIGNLFGRKKPKIPAANAEVYLNYTSDKFQLGAVSVANGGSLNLVWDMATSAKDTLNGLITIMAGGMQFEAMGWASGLYRNGRWLAMEAGVQSFYGHTGGQIWVKLGNPNAAQQNVASADEAVSKGVLWSLDATKIVGGDIFAKRAVLNSAATDLTALLGDLQIASDYNFYVRNRQLIDGYISHAYTSLTEPEKLFYQQNKAFIDRVHVNGYSALSEDDWEQYNSNQVLIDKIISALEAQANANPWIITLQRASELGLGKWAGSDFYGGLPGFLMSMGLPTARLYMEDITLSSAGGLRLSAAVRTEEGPFSILAQSDANGWAVTINDLAAIGYLNTGGGATAGNDLVDYSASWSTISWSDPSGGDDIVLGGNLDDNLQGWAGWDWLSGGGGSDYLRGGAGNDVLIGGGGGDTLYGDEGDDYLAGGEGHDLFFGGAGNDTLVGGAGSDTLIAGDGDDVLLVDEYDGYLDNLYGEGGTDALSFERWSQGATFALASGSLFGHGYQGIENILGSPYDDVISGDANSNYLFGNAGQDTISGEDGDDVLEGGSEADSLQGGAGADYASYEGSTDGVYVNLSSGEAFAGDATGDAWSSIENLRGSRFDDELVGDAGVNVLEGKAGDDWLVVTQGADILDGGDGADTADFSMGTFVAGYSTYQVWVDDGYWQWDDWLQQNVWIENGGHYEPVTEYIPGVTVNLLEGFAGVRTADGVRHLQTLIGIEHVMGSAGDDVIYLAYQDEAVTGGAGNDIIYGNMGNDTFYFERGNGFDTIYEDNSGDNTLSLAGDIRASDLGFGVQGGANGYFDVWTTVNAGDRARFVGNFAASGNNRLKTIDLNGAGQIDVSAITSLRTGSNGWETIYGAAGQADLIISYGATGGWDVAYGAGPSGWESQGNVFIGGALGSSFVGSVGDDQYVYESGDGWDTVVDAGGDDTLVFGASVKVNTVAVSVEDDSLMVYYGAGDRVRIADGANRYIDAYTGETSLNTIEHINAGGTWIDLRKLDIPWIDYYSYSGSWSPIAFDLAGDGLNLISVEQSQIVSQLDSGKFARTGWVGPTDGLLAFDRDGNGQIDRLEEISFVGDAEGAKTDLEGLRGWDANADGKLNAQDEGWSKLKIWVDRNQNGRSTSGELRTLDEAGIAEIDLKGVATGFDGASSRDNYVHNTMSFTWASGKTGTAYDIVLARRLLQDKKLTAEQVRAAWGDGKTGGTLGRLLNDPMATAVAARQLASLEQLQRDGEWSGIKGLLVEAVDGYVDLPGGAAPVELVEALGELTLEEVNALAQVDFSDHDQLYADEEARWLDQLLGRKTDGLDKEGVSAFTDPSVFAADRDWQTSGPARGGAFVKPTFGADDQGTDGYLPIGSSGGVQAGQSEHGAMPRARFEDAGGLNPRTPTWSDIDEAASLLQSSQGDRLDAWAPAEVTLASGSIGRKWWAEQVLETEAPFAFNDDLLSGFGDEGRRRAELATEDPAMLSAHQKLTQAMAGFGSPKGAGAAVWKRSGELSDQFDTAADARTSRWRFGAPMRMSA